MMIRTTFQAVKLHAKKSGKCACGKAVKRNKTFEQTQNPFNKNRQGEPKTVVEIHADLQREAAEWTKQPLTCGRCAA